MTENCSFEAIGLSTERMAHYLLIDEAGLVQNVVVWDGTSPMELPENWTAQELADGEYYEFGKPPGIDPPSPKQPIK